MKKIIAPVITVFDSNEKPDYEGNKKVIDFLINGGVDGILVLGSAGEFTNLSVEERIEFMSFYSEYVNGRVELFAGTGAVSYYDTLKLTNAAIKLGLTPMVIGPYYFGIDQEKLFIYYDRLAKEVDGDFYLYSYPPRTGHSLEPETIGKLMEILVLSGVLMTFGNTTRPASGSEHHFLTIFILQALLKTSLSFYMAPTLVTPLF